MWGQPPSAVRSSEARRFLVAIDEIRPINSTRAKLSPMTKTQPTLHRVSTADQTLALSSLEHDQLANAKKHPIPRRHLKGPELLVLWSLRIYLLFMMTVVAYQVWLA